MFNGSDLFINAEIDYRTERISETWKPVRRRRRAGRDPQTQGRRGRRAPARDHDAI